MQYFLAIIFSTMIGLAFSNLINQAFFPASSDGRPNILMERVGDAVKESVVSTVQSTASTVTGGLIPPPKTQPPKTTSNGSPAYTDSRGQYVPEYNPPKEANPTVERFTNPWLYATIGGLLLFGTTFVRQTRGLARDVGSGVSSTRDAVKNDFGELQSDPGNPRRRG